MAGKKQRLTIISYPAKMKINVVGRKLIKPCSPTPPNLKIYKISYIDEISPEFDVSILLFYQSKPKEAVSQLLEESLAKILPQFYPLAGRYVRKDHTVDCSDQGVEFIEAEAGSDCMLADIVGATTSEDLKHVLPRTKYRMFDTDPILSVQITEGFKCGGVVIGISISHKICDASSLGTLIVAWSNATNPEGKLAPIITPRFDCFSFFPPKMKENVVEAEAEPAPTDDQEVAAKRFVFNKQVIARLRSKYMENEGISRVRVVTAVIAKALMSVDRARKGGKSRASIISHVVNMRERTIPPLHTHTCGNLGLVSFTRSINLETAEEEDYSNKKLDIGVGKIAREVGDAINRSISDCAVILSAGEDVLDSLLSVITNDMLASSADQNVLVFSDWTKFGFYEADFGWGKPVWAAVGVIPGENVVLLVDNAERDGIEAWVHLLDDGMPCFEQELGNLLS